MYVSFRPIATRPSMIFLLLRIGSDLLSQPYDNILQQILARGYRLHLQIRKRISGFIVTFVVNTKKKVIKTLANFDDLWYI